MFKVNQDYLKLPGSYLFSTVARKQREYQACLLYTSDAADEAGMV